MASIEPRERARHAYERGRIRLGLRAALAVIPLMALSMLICGRPELTLPTGGALFAVTAWLRARGQAYGRALVPGYLAGCAPLALPVALRASGHCCVGGACWSGCILACVAGGLFAGIATGFLSTTERDKRGPFFVSMLLVSGLVGGLGCAMAGLSGVLGMAVALGTTSLPISWVAQRDA